MELFFGVIVSAAVGYLVTQVSDMRKEVTTLREDVLWIQVKLDRRGPKPSNETPID